MLERGERFDRYIVEELLGKGGMAAVYKVRHQHLGSLHAMKVLLISLPSVRTRLMQEGRAQANLRHPNIVSVTDVLTVDRSPALVMEYVEGPSLEALLERGPLPLDESLELFEGVVLGVAAAHAAGVVHRDLKPGNILLAPTQHGLLPKVMDFGLVKAMDHDKHTTVTGAALGTPAYMAPEQIRDPSAVDERADLWGLGCLLYELVTRARAFPAEDAFDLYDAIRDGVYVDPLDLQPELPERIVEVIRELLTVDPTERIQTCEVLYERLYGRPLIRRESQRLQLRGVTPQPALRDESTSGRPPAIREDPHSVEKLQGRLQVLEDQRRRERRTLVLGALAVLLLLVGAGWLGVRAIQTGPEVGTDRTARVDPPEPVPVPVPEPPEPAPVPVNVEGADIVVPVPEPVVPVPEPVVPAPAAPQPVVPAPAAPQPVVPQPEGSAEEALATVEVQGDAVDVWLELDGVRVEPGPGVAVGEYVLYSKFDDGTVTERELKVREGERVVLRCSSFSFSCAKVR